MNNLHFTVEKTKAQKERDTQDITVGVRKKNFLLKGQIVVGILDCWAEWSRDNYSALPRCAKAATDTTK